MTSSEDDAIGTNQSVLVVLHGFPRDHGEFQLRGPRRPRHRVSKAEMAPEVLLPRRELQLCGWA